MTTATVVSATVVVPTAMMFVMFMRFGMLMMRIMGMTFSLCAPLDVFLRVLLKQMETTRCTEIVDLSLVLDFRRGCFGIDPHATNDIFDLSHDETSFLFYYVF